MSERDDAMRYQEAVEDVVRMRDPAYDIRNRGARQVTSPTKQASDEVTMTVAEYRELVEALTGLSDMYASTWDRVGGGLMMMDSGVARFEKAHAKAAAVLAKHTPKDAGGVSL